MTGRDELESKYDSKIDELLLLLPDYCYSYYKSMTNKTNGTKYSYLSKINEFLKYIDIYTDLFSGDPFCLGDVKPSMINDFLNNHIYSESANKAVYYYAIKSLFEFLYLDDYIDKNPCQKIKAPIDKKEHKITYLTDDEIKTVMDNVENGIGSRLSKIHQRNWRYRNKAIMSLAISTGLRSSSIRGLNVEDVNIDECTIKIFEKGNKERTLRISESMAKILEDWMIDRVKKINEMDDVYESALFISERGQRLSNTSFTNLVTVFTSNIDKHITPHKLRSTYATHAIKKTHDIYLVANQLGHSNIKNTARYAAVDEEMAEKAATAMDDILF